MTAVDNELRCNNMRCRAQLGLEEQAVVTTCSHIFCLDCANREFSGGRICPACERSLKDDDDVVVSYLSPSTNYKASILAGLTPALVLEIAARALSFWTYQTSQEAAFQSMVLKNAESRCEEAREIAGGSKHDIKESIANKKVQNELARAKRDLKEYESQLSVEKRRSQGFEQALKEKERELLKMKGMSDNMMKRAVLGNAAQAEIMRNAANQPSPLEGNRTVDRRRMMAGTPLPSSQAPQPFHATPNNHAPPSTTRGPIFYPKISSTTSAYTSRQPSSGFQLHPTTASSARPRVSRDLGLGQRSQRTGSEAPSDDGRRLRGRQAVGPAYYGAP